MWPVWGGGEGGTRKEEGPGRLRRRAEWVARGGGRGRQAGPQRLDLSR